MSRFALDLDGTLLDCWPRQVGLAAELTARLGGVALDAEAFRALKREGGTTIQALQRLGLLPALAAAIGSAWADGIESEHWLARDVLVAGALDVLESLRTAGFHPFVVTARRDADAVRREVQRLQLAPLIESLIVVHPSRAAAEKAAALRGLGVSAFVGDTESDARAAEMAAVPFAAVSGGQRSGSFLRGAGVRHIRDDLRSAVDVLTGA